MWLHTAQLSVIICILLHCVHAQNWTHHAILDKAGLFHLYWNPPDDKSPDSEITFRVEVQAKGYFELGFAPNGGTATSDIVTGWIKDGEVYFQDWHADAFSPPMKDEQQDYKLIDAYENDTFTVFEFSRKLDTCDDDDWLIDDSTVKAVYSYSNEDPESDDPFENRENDGVKSIILLAYIFDKASDLDFDSLSKWEILGADVNFSAIDTLYWCKIYRTPEVSERQHIIYTEIVVQEGNENFMHHMVLFECSGGPEEFDILLDDKGYECHTPEMPKQMTKCQTTIATWGVGGHDVPFPEHVGFPIETGPPKYYMLESHYDNQQLTNEALDRSGLIFYYTPNLRKYDLGFLVAGASISPRTVIPPGQERYIVVGHGNPECAGVLFPEEGAKAIGLFPHSHLLARALKVRHFRGDVELKPIFDDKFYDFNYQAYRFFPEEITVLPGDVMSIECTFNSTERDKVTHGGFSTRDEMCEIALLYYPRVPPAVAYSAVTFDVLNELLNINATTDDEVDIALDTIDWNTIDIAKFQNTTRYSPQETQCFYIAPPGENNNSLITYPSQFTPYEPPPRMCN